MSKKIILLNMIADQRKVAFVIHCFLSIDTGDTGIKFDALLLLLMMKN